MKKKNYILRAFVFLYKASPIRVSLSLLLVLCQRVFPALSIFVSMKLINWIAVNLRNASQILYSEILTILAAYAGVTFLSELFAGIQSVFSGFLYYKQYRQKAMG